MWEGGEAEVATGTPPWASSTGNQGRGGHCAATSCPAAFSKNRTAFFGGMNFCIFLAPSEV